MALLNDRDAQACKLNATLTTICVIKIPVRSFVVKSQCFGDVNSGGCVRTVGQESKDTASLSIIFVSIHARRAT